MKRVDFIKYLLYNALSDAHDDVKLVLFVEYKINSEMMLSASDNYFTYVLVPIMLIYKRMNGNNQINITGTII